MLDGEKLLMENSTVTYPVRLSNGLKAVPANSTLKFTPIPDAEVICGNVTSTGSAFGLNTSLTNFTAGANVPCYAKLSVTKSHKSNASVPAISVHAHFDPAIGEGFTIPPVAVAAQKVADGAGYIQLLAASSGVISPSATYETGECNSLHCCKQASTVPAMLA